MGVDIREQGKRKGMSHKEISAKGGKGGAGKPKIREGKRCWPGCHLWERCPAKYLSHAGEIIEDIHSETSVDYQGKCALVHSSQSVKHKVMKITTGTAEDFNDFLMEFYGDLYIQAHDGFSTHREKMTTFKAGLDLKKSSYGEKTIIEGQMNMEQNLGVGVLSAIWKEVVGDEKEAKTKKKTKKKSTKKTKKKTTKKKPKKKKK